MPAGNPFHVLDSESGAALAVVSGPAPRITSLLIKPASAVCNLDCSYCFYLDRDADPYKDLPARRMTFETLERLVDTYLFYSYPASTFAFQGGEPTLAGLDFFTKLISLQQRFGRNGQAVSNALQTNGILIDKDWCQLFRSYNWLIGLSLDGTEDINDQYRFNRGGQGTWKRVMQALETMQSEKVEFNILCVVSQSNVRRAKDVWKFYRSHGIAHIQFIPLAEFHPDGTPMDFAVNAQEYGQFLCEIFDLWWPERRKVRVRFFDNLAEAVAGIKPGSCTMHETCDSYVVVEYNGDIYPCDFFVEGGWKLGNVSEDSWSEIARRVRRYNFASKKTLAHPECQVCEYQAICHGGCPKTRHGPNHRFEDLDWFCGAYKMIFAKAVGPLRKEVEKLYGKSADLRPHSLSPY
jgi:uncharacterized protein